MCERKVVCLDDTSNDSQVQVHAVEDEEEMTEEERTIEKEYLHWKKHCPYLYDSIATFRLGVCAYI